MKNYKNFYNKKKNKNSNVCNETKNNFITHFVKENKLIKSKKIDNLNV